MRKTPPDPLFTLPGVDLVNYCQNLLKMPFAVLSEPQIAVFLKWSGLWPAATPGMVREWVTCTSKAFKLKSVNGRGHFRCTVGQLADVAKRRAAVEV
jgi:hypothetical protein